MGGHGASSSGVVVRGDDQPLRVSADEHLLAELSDPDGRPASPTMPSPTRARGGAATTAAAWVRAGGCLWSGDVLYLHVGAPQDAEGEETPEGHVLRFEPGTQRIVGLTVINARWLLDRDGRLTITIPETVEASADDLAAALAAA